MTTSAAMGSATGETRDGLTLEIADVAVRSRFEATVGGELEAFAQYVPRGEHVDFVHTVTEPGWGGRGVAAALVRCALDLVRAADRRVIPHCPFVAATIHDHPGFADLVDERHRSLVRTAARG